MLLKPKIRERRMEKHLTQTELAKKINISVSYLSRIEKGHIKPSVETLWLIARGIGCLVDELYEVSN